MYQRKRMFRYRVLLIVLLIAAIASGCEGQTPRGPTDLVPILCHSEPGVGLLFITIENHGDDAGPSTTTLEFNTASPKMPRARLEVKIPNIPSGTDVWVAVELPSVPGTAGFIEPVGKITITADSMKVLRETNRADKTLVTGCNDRA
jgi:hypothetical protein